MNEIEELRAKIEELNKKFAELLQKEEQKQKLWSKVWKPKKNDEYYVIDYDGSIYSDSCYDSCVDENIVNYGNYFDNEEQARKQAEFNRVYNRFRKYVEAYSEPLDWKNEDKEKYYVDYKYYDNSLGVKSMNLNQDAFQIYASSEQVLCDAIIYSAGSEKEFARIIFGVKE